MTDASREVVRRILVAVDASVRSQDVLDTAADLASRLSAQLLALFVEDEDLLKLSELPFAKELDRSSGAMRPLDPEMLSRALETDARRLRQRLTEQSSKRRIDVSMQVVRGQYATAAVGMAGDQDVVLLNDVGGFSVRVSAVTGRHGVQKRRAENRPVWVLYDGSEGSRRGLSLAARLSLEYGSDLIVVAAGQPADAEAEIGRVWDAAARGRCELLTLSDPDAVLAAAQTRGVAVLVLPKAGRRTALSHPVLGKIRCPRMLV